MRFVFSVIFAVFVMAHAARADLPVLTVATGDYEPFTSESLPEGGFVNGIVRRIVEQAGYGVEFKFMPWKRNMEATRRGIYHASSYWFYSEEREADFYHIGPIHEVRQLFFVRADANIENWTRLEDLAGLRIGVVPGYTYTPEFWALVEEGVLTISEATSDEANLKKLLAGRIDAYPFSEVGGWHIIEQTFSPEDAEQITVLETPFSRSIGYLLLSRAIPDADVIATRLQSAADELNIGQ